MHDAQALFPALVLLAAGLAAILAARATGVSAIVGFLIAGMALGVHGLGVVEENAVTRLLAELGVVFLLFDIGLHFSLKEAREVRQELFSLAPLQILLTGAAFAAGARLFGLDWMLAIVLGAAFALSSTAVVARLLAERGLIRCPIGRSSTAVLIVQDVAAIFLLVLATSMEADGLAVALGMAAIKSALAFTAALTVGRFAVRPAFNLLARTRNEEAFTAAALLVVLATAAATGALGLSLTLGAFLAGVIIGETPYRHVVKTEVAPFRALLLGFFFITVGMGLDARALAFDLPVVLAISAALLVSKTALVVVAALMVRWTLPGATRLAFLLAQGSEFALVILALPGVAGALDPQTSARLVAAVAVSLALTPAWAELGTRLSRRLAAARPRPAAPTPAAPAAEADDRPYLVFAMNEVGRTVVDALKRHDVPVIAIELDPERFFAAVADGYDVAFGDPADLRLMTAVGATRARGLVLAASRYEISREVTPYVAQHHPDLARFVAVADEAERDRHRLLGMLPVIGRSSPPGLDLAAAVLAHAGVAQDKLAAWLETMRAETAEAMVDATAA